jgi:cell division septal protein FtsQ
VKSVSIVGAPTQESQALVLRLVDVEKNLPLARVEPRSISRRISTIDWVERVQSLGIGFRGTVKVTLSPRKPIAYFNGKTLDASR